MTHNKICNTSDLFAPNLLLAESADFAPGHKRSLIEPLQLVAIDARARAPPLVLTSAFPYERARAFMVTQLQCKQRVIIMKSLFAFYVSKVAGIVNKVVGEEKKQLFQGLNELAAEGEANNNQIKVNYAFF